jgi:hypothetical protein
MNMEAGLKLYRRKPRTAPEKAPNSMAMRYSPFKTERITNTTEVKKVTPAARPSRPSIRFTALIKSINQKTVIK